MRPWLSVWLGLALAFSLGFLLAGPSRVFPLLGIKPSTPDFADARVVTAACESLREGHDPLLENPRDPWARPFNYPRIWLLAARTGLNQSHTAALSYFFIAAFFTGWLLFVPKDTGWPAISAMLAVAVSPANLLGMERGNIDLFMFLLLAAAIRGATARPAWAAAAGWLALATAFLLKLYPLAGIAAFAAAPRRRMLIAGTATALLAVVWLFLTRHDLTLISQATPRATGLSYGRDVLWMEIAQHSNLLGQCARIFSWLGIAAAAILFWLPIRQGAEEKTRASTMPPAHTRPADTAAFLAGSAVYGGTFLLGNNWDYRLVFLLFTIPYLVHAIRNPLPHAPARTRLAAAISLAAALLSCWHISIFKILSLLPGGGPASVLLDEAANWTLLLGLAYLAGCHASTLLPTWSSGRCPAGVPAAEKDT